MLNPPENYLERIERYQRDIILCREDVWKIRQERVQVCWAVEDTIIRMNQLFSDILRMEEGYRAFIFEHPELYDPEVENKIEEMGQEWLSLSRELLP